MNIRDLSVDERTVQLIEECGECIQAAAKLIRAMHGWSTPIKPIEAREHLIEEIADVSVCMTALGDMAPLSDVGEIITQKAARWEERINDPETRRKMMEGAYGEE